MSDAQDKAVEIVADALVDRWNAQPYQGQMAMADADAAVAALLAHPDLLADLAVEAGGLREVPSDEVEGYWVCEEGHPCVGDDLPDRCPARIPHSCGAAWQYIAVPWEPKADLRVYVREVQP